MDNKQNVGEISLFSSLKQQIVFKEITHILIN